MKKLPLIFSCLLLCACMLTSIAFAAPSKNGVVTLTITPSISAQNTNLNVWVPYPLSNEAQQITDIRTTGNFATSAVYRDPQSEAMFLHTKWNSLAEQPALSFQFHIAQKSRSITTPLKDKGLPIPEPIRERYLRSTFETPAKIYVGTAGEIIAGKKTLLEKARAVYDWTVNNTVRDPNVRGCGLGSPEHTLSEKNGGGKCADISAVFVTMARAAGVPARDVYGLRLGTPKNGNITSAFHCWAEFYLPGTGWVPVDPADVRKMMLVHKLKDGSRAAEEWREFFWAGDDLFRVALNKESRGVTLTPKQKGSKVSYLMYPYAEIDDKALDYRDAKSFRYTVTYKAD